VITEDNRNIHATGICINGQGVIIIGPSGSGKSDLALRLIDRGATLISDDRIIINIRDNGITLNQAPNIEGKLEVRGIGILCILATNNIPLRMLVDLNAKVERLPDQPAYQQIAGISLPCIAISGFEASAPIKVELALTSVIEKAIVPCIINIFEAGS
jgi:HPr kinase/phosphorylase